MMGSENNIYENYNNKELNLQNKKRKNYQTMKVKIKKKCYCLSKISKNYG